MQERIKTIITASWTAAVNQTETNIREIFDRNATLSHGTFFSLYYLFAHVNCFSFFFSSNYFASDEKSFWDEANDDNPKSLKQALDTNRQTHRLLMKSKGYSIEICRICNELDLSVESIYNDLSLYVNSTTTESIELREDPIIRKEQSNLIAFLKSCSQTGVLE